MADPIRTEDSMNMSIHLSKIGAKITQTSQPFDLRPFLKNLKMSGRNSTSNDTLSDMSTSTVDRLFKRVSREK